MRFANRMFCLARAVLDAPSGARWFHTVPPMGEYPGGNIFRGGQEIKNAVLVIDREAYDRILAAFAADTARLGHGLLVDREHFSLDTDKPSDAMAWATDIREDADGLWTRWDFTPPGLKMWEDRVLISRSPVMQLEPIGGNRFRPVRLESVAMTNTPHFDLSTIAAARAADNQPDGCPPDGNHTQGDNTMNRLLALLGLPETATEDEAVAALQALIDAKSAADQAQADAEAARDEAQAACRKARCDAFIAAHRDAIADEAKFRAAYEANPDATEAAFGAFKAAKPAAPATRISARLAATPGDGAAAAPVTLAAYRAMPPGRDKDAYLARHKDTLLRLEREEAQDK